MNQRTLWLLLFPFLLLACSKKGIPEKGEIPSILSLGDSYTIGQGVAEAERWPNQLKDFLIAQDCEVGNVEIIAQTGWTTANLLAAIDAQLPQQANLVTLLIGVNNQFQGKSFDMFQSEFKTLLNLADSLSKSDNGILVVSIPDYGVTPFGSNNSKTIRKELDMYNAFMNTECNSQSIPFVNITDISRALGGTTPALAPDQLHPSGFQYSKWVEIIGPIAFDLLK